MDKLFWVIPGKIAGRPGPDREPWNLDSLRESGIGAVLSVNDGLLCHPEDFEAVGIGYACIPLSSNAPSLPEDEAICLTALPKAFEFVEAQIASGHAVMVHCSGGKDRTGLFLCYFLMKYAGLSGNEAIDAVRQVRPIALSAPGWDEFAHQVLGSFT
jgi:protein-tyrosine phosphatase